MDRARTQIRKASESEPEVKRTGSRTGVVAERDRYRKALEAIARNDEDCDTDNFHIRVSREALGSSEPSRDDSALLAKARGLLVKLLPYAGESYDSMTNAQAKDCAKTIDRVSELLGK